MYFFFNFLICFMNFDKQVLVLFVDCFHVFLVILVLKCFFPRLTADWTFKKTLVRRSENVLPWNECASFYQCVNGEMMDVQWMYKIVLKDYMYCPVGLLLSFLKIFSIFLIKNAKFHKFRQFFSKFYTLQ